MSNLKEISTKLSEVMNAIDDFELIVDTIETVKTQVEALQPQIKKGEITHADLQLELSDINEKLKSVLTPTRKKRKTRKNIDNDNKVSENMDDNSMFNEESATPPETRRRGRPKKDINTTKRKAKRKAAPRS